MDQGFDKAIYGLLDNAAQTKPEPFEQVWDKCFLQAQQDANTALKLKLRTELIVAGLLTLASTVGIGLVLKFAELFARQPAAQLVH
jgi:hypothetical protein